MYKQGGGQGQIQDFHKGQSMHAVCARAHFPFVIHAVVHTTRTRWILAITGHNNYTLSDTFLIE